MKRDNPLFQPTHSNQENSEEFQESLLIGIDINQGRLAAQVFSIEDPETKRYTAHRLATTFNLIATGATDEEVQQWLNTSEDPQGGEQE